jgi:flap endonuclease-1
MGVNFKDLVLKHQIELDDLKGKKIAVDAFNTIFQFLAIIRQRDGTPLMDSKGNITSHLSGLFYRTINLIEAGIQPVFVFDGAAPVEKQSVQEERAKIKEKAEELFRKALEEEDFETARKYAQQTSKLTTPMINESKQLISAMGLPWVQAIAEGEAQASYMAMKGHVWAVASQDYDALLFGTPRLVRNLSITGRKKIAGKDAYSEVKIEMINLSETLNYHQFDIKSLVDLALMLGTDYNPGGVQGVGPKTALKVIKEGKFEEYKKQIMHYDKIRNLFLKPTITKDYTLDWKQPDVKKIKEILCDKHDFSEERIDLAIKRLTGKDANQKGLGDFI